MGGCLDCCGECIGWITVQLGYLLLGITYLIITGGYSLWASFLQHSLRMQADALPPQLSRGATYVGFITMQFDLMSPAERMVLLAAPSGAISIAILGGVVLLIWYATKSDNDGTKTYYKGAWFAWLVGNAVSGAGAGILGWLMVRVKQAEWPNMPSAGTATLGSLVGFLVVSVPFGFLGAIAMYFRGKVKAKRAAQAPVEDVEYGLVGETEAGKLAIDKPSTTYQPLAYRPPSYPPPYVPPSYQPIVQEL